MPITEERQKELQQELAVANQLMKWCLQSESAKHINAALDLARSEPGIPFLPEEMDLNPWLLNCRNGTVELRTGKLREHRREDLITKLCPTEFDPAAPCPTWKRFLGSVFAEDEELITFVQKFFGYCLTGDVSEQVLPILWGGGSNGKTTLLNAIQGTVGSDYVLTANEDLLVKSQHGRHPTEMAQLFRVRLVVASETEDGAQLNEKRIKAMTGGDRITARRMREDFWEFAPTHKVILLTNHKPKVVGTDHAIWRRLRLVPFGVTFWKPDDHQDGGVGLDPQRRVDPQMAAKLAAEQKGILAWLVQGALDWQREGLPVPAKVKVATAEYRTEEDTIAQFLQERCNTHRELRVRAETLYQAFRKWCEGQGTEPLSQKKVGAELTQRGFERILNNGTWYKGLTLISDSENGSDRWHP
jgi:putative DNA primase/helicase